MHGNGGKIRQRTPVWPCTVPQSVETSHGGTVTIFLNQQVRTDRTLANKLDIIIRDNKKGTCVLTDGAIAGDSNCDQEIS